MAMLSGGTVLGQLTLVASSPILTRLYGPESFGGFAVFMSLAAILAMVAALRYEFAVPVARDEREAVELVGVGNAASVAMALATALGVWLGGDWMARITSVPDLMPLLWLLPVTVLFNGLALPLTFWSIRRGTFRVNTTNKLVQAVGQAGGQLALGFAGMGPPGLILGYCLGPLIQFQHFLRALPTAERRALFFVSSGGRWAPARREPPVPGFFPPPSRVA